jgi:hypothetical protein
MTNTQMLTNDQIEARLRSALHRRAEIEVPDTATPPPVHWPVDELAVRRRQGWLAPLAVAATILLVAGGTFATQLFGSKNTPDPAAPSVGQTPSPTPTGTSSSAPVTTASAATRTIGSFASLPHGEPPQMMWFSYDREASSVLHRVDGRQIPVSGDVLSAVPFGDGAIVSRPSAGTSQASRSTVGLEIVTLGGSGNEEIRFQGSGPALSPDGAVIAVWNSSVATPSVELFSARGGSEPELIPFGPATGAVFVKGFVDNRTVVVRVVEAGKPDSVALVNRTSVRAIPTFTDVSAVNPTRRLIAGTYPTSDNVTCAAIVSADDPTTRLWQSCESYTKAFSTDGKYAVLAMGMTDGAPFRDRLYIAEVDSGKVVATIVGSTTQVAADGADSFIIAAVDGRGRGGFLRCTVAGSCEVALDLPALGSGTGQGGEQVPAHLGTGG